MNKQSKKPVKSRRFMVRFEQEEGERLAKEARQAGVPISTYLRMLVATHPGLSAMAHIRGR